MSQAQRARSDGSKFDRREFLDATFGAAVVSTIALQSDAASTCNAGVEETTYAESLRTPVIGRYQVVVAGGGPSGVIAAVAAARSGAKTLLVEALCVPWRKWSRRFDDLL